MPRLVAGLARRVVTAVAAAKHHTAAVTDAGEVWTWGSNRDGRLGYPAVDTQPTPRRRAASMQAVIICSLQTKLCMTAAPQCDVSMRRSPCRRVLGDQ